MVHPAALPDEQLLSQCEIQALRRGGPGGQHRNKVSTAILLTHTPSGVAAEANERRSQADNRRVALRRLRIRLALALRSPHPRTPLSDSVWRKYRRAARLAIDPENPDFALLLAETLDVLWSQDFDWTRVCQILEISSSQLQKFLKREPAAWQAVNRERLNRNLRPLH